MHIYILKLYKMFYIMYTRGVFNMKFNNIGEVISALRRQIGITQEELGSRTGLNRVIIAKIENNQRAVSLEEAINVSKVFSMDVETLYGYIKAEEGKLEEEAFVMAFRAKGMSPKNLVEVRRIELLVDALCTQNEINRGE